MLNCRHISIIVPVILMFFLACGRPRGNESPDILLISLDTTRWDYLSSYGRGRTSTPCLDALAQTGVLFTRAVTTAPVTLPAHVSIMTGLYPLSHGVRNNGNYRLDGEIPTIAGVLRQRGYRTGAVVGAFVLDSQFGLSSGFDVYDDRMQAGRGDRLSFTYNERNGDAVTDGAISFVEHADSSPLFLWVHYFDPHFPYQPPPAFQSGDPYGGEVSYVDACVGRLLSRFEEIREKRPLVTIVVGDHGEDLGDRGEMTHGVFLYDTTLRVPLIVSFPEKLQSGTRSDAVVSVIDIFPTVLALAGVDTAIPGLEGRSLVANAGGDGAPDRSVYIETMLPFENKGWSPLEGVISGDWKYIKAPREELYNLRDDPVENRNLASTEGELVRKMSTTLDSLVRQLSVDVRSSRVDADHETMERLARLGYVTDVLPAGDEPPDRELKDPKDMLPVLSMHQIGLGYYETGRYAEADTAFRTALEYDPTNVTLLNYRGLSLYQLDRQAEALKLWERALEINPAYVNVLLNEGMAFLDGGDADSALEAYDRVLSLNPQYVRALVGKGRALRALGDVDEARDLFERAIEINPASAEARLWMGIFLKEVGDPDEALKELEEASRLDPGMLEAQREQGMILISLGRTGEAVPIFRSIVSRSPGSPKCLVDLGIALERDGQDEPALERYSGAVALDPDYYIAYNNLGSVLDRLDRSSEAEAAYREALRIKPDFPEAYYNLGFLLERLGRRQEARVAFSRFLELWPDEDAARDRALAALAELGRE